jgi:hypothetical protein
MLTKKQSRGYYWAGFVLNILSIFSARLTFSQAVISLLINPPIYWVICRVLWTVANSIRPIETREKAPLRYWLIMLWPFIAGLIFFIGLMVFLSVAK